MTTITNNDLDQFCGTESYYKATLGNLLITDGIKFLADSVGAYWLVDLVASYQPQLRKDERLREFQLWRFEVRPDHKGTVTCRGDSGEKAVVTQEIALTDFPIELAPFEFYVGGK